jgi:hypothetical protein
LSPTLPQTAPPTFNPLIPVGWTVDVRSVYKKIVIPCLCNWNDQRGKMYALKNGKVCKIMYAKSKLLKIPLDFAYFATYACIFSLKKAKICMQNGVCIHISPLLIT